jgi:hypothetical protein
MRKFTLMVSILALCGTTFAQHTTKKPSGAIHSGSQTATATQSPVRADPTLIQEAPATGLTDATADLPTGTAIKMKLETPLSSRNSKEGDGFSGRVTERVTVNGRTVIPVGASVTGRVIRVSDPRRIGGVGSLDLLPEAVILPNGKTFALNAVMVDTSTPNRLNVDDEGRIKAGGFNGADKAEIAAGTGAGAIVGTIAGGGKGFLIGSMIGGGATAIHWLTKKHSVEVPAGTELIMEISRPMNISGTTLTAAD